MPWGSQQEGFKQTSSPNQFLFSLTHNVTIPLESNGHSSDHYVGEGALFTSYNNGYVPAFSMLTKLLSIASRVGLDLARLVGGDMPRALAHRHRRPQWGGPAPVLMTGFSDSWETHAFCRIQSGNAYVSSVLNSSAFCGASSA